MKKLKNKKTIITVVIAVAVIACALIIRISCKGRDVELKETDASRVENITEQTDWTRDNLQTENAGNEATTEEQAFVLTEENASSGMETGKQDFINSGSTMVVGSGESESGNSQNGTGSEPEEVIPSQGNQLSNDLEIDLN